MKVLVVHAHPDPESFGAALRDAVIRGLRAADHDVTVIDLEAEDYQPCLTTADYEGYGRNGDPGGSGHPDATVARHIDAVRATDALVFTFPTFWSGLPAVLKGWIDRTLLPGVSFSVRDDGSVRGELGNVRNVVGVTTYGSPRGYRWIVGDGGRRTIRTIRWSCGWRCRMRWLSLDALDGRADSERRAFLADVEQKMTSL